jgi:hypothetical protein
MVSIRKVKCGLVGLVVVLVCAAVVMAADEPAGSDKANSSRQLREAKARVRAKIQARLDAALQAMEQSHKQGTPVEAAEEMASSGLQQGLDAKDFEPLGKFVASQHAGGLKGKELSGAIRSEVQRRQAARKQDRLTKKEGKGKGKDKGKDKDLEKGKGKNQDKVKPKDTQDKIKGQGKGQSKGKGKGKDKKKGKGKR